MNKTKLKYIKYTKKELDSYVRDKNSCIYIVNSEMHLGFPPWGFTSFQETITNIISRDKIGKYDPKMDGIVLDVRNIKVFGTEYPVHDDDPINHLNIKANFYIFRPRIGVVINGIAKHISHGHVAVIIYRVFNVSIRFKGPRPQKLKINDVISIRIKRFDLHDAMPYIEAEFVSEVATTNVTNKGNKRIKFDDDNEEINAADSGISTEENPPKKNIINNKKKMVQATESSTEESSSDTESDEDNKSSLIANLIPNVKIKQEKLSDSESEERYRKAVAAKYEKQKESSSSSDSSSSEESSSEDESKPMLKSKLDLSKVKKEKVSSESSGDNKSESSEESNESDSSSEDLQRTIKREMSPIEASTSAPPLKKIKSEPMSDIENGKTFKRPTNLNISAKTNGKRKREMSFSEHLDSIMEDTLDGASTSTSKNVKSQNKLNVTLNDTANLTAEFQSPALSSTLKPSSRIEKAKKRKSSVEVKQEKLSDDDSTTKHKKSRKTKKSNASLGSKESELFSSFMN